jgi:hypothetical protein
MPGRRPQLVHDRRLLLIVSLSECLRDADCCPIAAIPIGTRNCSLPLQKCGRRLHGGLDRPHFCGVFITCHARPVYLLP